MTRRRYGRIDLLLCRYSHGVMPVMRLKALLKSANIAPVFRKTVSDLKERLRTNGSGFRGPFRIPLSGKIRGQFPFARFSANLSYAFWRALLPILSSFLYVEAKSVLWAWSGAEKLICIITFDSAES